MSLPVIAGEGQIPDPQVIDRVEAALQGPLQLDDEPTGEAALPSVPGGPAFVARVLYEDGEPIGLLRLRCLVLPTPPQLANEADVMPANPLPGSYRVETAAGEFRLPAVAQQYYYLQIWPEHGMPLETCLPALANETNPHVIRAVRAATVRGVVIDAADAPIAGAWVALADDGEAGTATAEDGSFTMPPLRPGRLLLRVEAAGHAALEQEVLCEARQPSLLRLRLIGDAVLQGRIQPWQPGKAPHCAVELVDSRGMRRRASIADDGNYELHGLAPGSYHLRLLPLAEGLQAYAAALAERGNQGIAIQVHAGQRLWQELSDPVAALSRVRGQAPGFPVGTRVAILPLDLAEPPESLLQLLQGKLGQAGEFEFPAVPAGRLLVRLLDATGEVLLSRGAAATAGSVVDLLLRAEVGGAVR